MKELKGNVIGKNEINLITFSANVRHHISSKSVEWFGDETSQHIQGEIRYYYAFT
jgi:hypothetical protein